MLLARTRNITGKYRKAVVKALQNGNARFNGMALMFAVVASLAAVGSQWVVQANQIGRWIAPLQRGQVAATGEGQDA